MSCAWSGSLKELKQQIANQSFLQKLSNGFETIYHAPSISERNSWSESIPLLVNVLGDTKFDSIQVIIELQMPVGAERADIVLLGGKTKNPKAIVVELKQWSNFDSVSETMEIAVPGIGIHQHPSLQALNYVGKLHFFNSHAADYQLSGIVFMHNATTRDVEVLNLGDASDWVKNAPIITKDSYSEFARITEDLLLPSDLPQEEYILFNQAPYEQSHHLFKFLRVHAQNIAKNAELALANSGMGLTEQQDSIKNEILVAVMGEKEVDFIIQGGPGSGKTLLSVSLLLKAAERNISCILALRNNRLQAILRQVLDSAYPGVSGMMMFFEPKQGKGVYHFEGKVNLLVIDEAQRMESSIIPTVLGKAKISAVFLDEAQRLNPPEQGTTINFTNSSKKVGKESVVRYLRNYVRCKGGEQYNTWIEGLLGNPANISDLLLSKQKWLQIYNFQFCKTFDELLDMLQNYRSLTDRVAMVASFTESPGNMIVTAPDNLRIGYPLTSGFSHYKNSEYRIPWLMSTSHYKKFWLGGGSNKLDRVASIYGAQGFESDYVGVVWGRDLVFRGGRWQLGNSDFSYDNIDRLITGKKFGPHRWNDEALDLVINRYRIFLTRGIKGTFVYCEDDDTRQQLFELNDILLNR